MVNNEVMSLVRRLKRSGIMKYPKNCQYCNKETKLHAHHDDYNKPNRVVFLCPKCHRQAHVGKIKIESSLYKELKHSFKVVPADYKTIEHENALVIRIDKPLKLLAQAKAKAEGLSLSCWIRRLIMKEVK